MSTLLPGLSSLARVLSPAPNHNPNQTYRVRNIPERYTQEGIKNVIESVLVSPAECCTIVMRTFAAHIARSTPKTYTATFNLTTETVPLLLQSRRNEWILENFDPANQKPGERLVIDTHFQGFTVLWSPEGADHEFEYVKVSLESMRLLTI
jgi:hypothetical protein